MIQRSLSEGAAQDDLWKSSRSDFVKHQAALAEKTDYQIMLTHYALERLLLPRQFARLVLEHIECDRQHLDHRGTSSVPAWSFPTPAAAILRTSRCELRPQLSDP